MSSRWLKLLTVCGVLWFSVSLPDAAWAAQDAGQDEKKNQASNEDAAAPDPTVAPIEVRTRIDENMFPSSWSVPDINAEAVQLKPQEEERARRLIAAAMTKYPVDVLRRNLKRVYLVDRLAYSGITAAGTNSLDRIYLVVRDPSEGYTDHFVESSFHHEFSSILLRNYRRHLDQQAWDACIPSGFKYGKDGVDAVKKGKASTTPKREYMIDGFMCQYAISSMENDFNLLAEELFTSKPKFWRRLGKYPMLRQKAELIMAFYGAIDESFTPARLRSFGRPEAKQDANQESKED